MTLHKIILASVLFMLLISCREAYISPVSSDSQNLLVIEGILNSGDTSTTITLSRSVPLLDTTQFKAETGAILRVESDNQEIFPLTEIGGGKYWAQQLPLQKARTYRLLITTSNGKHYESDFVPVVESPEIDSIGWDRDADKVTLHASTHDPSGSTRYYRWNYIETWEFHSPFVSEYEYIRPNLVERSDIRDLLICWKSLPSTTILVNSTVKLGEDIVHKFPLQYIMNGEVKLTVRYSIEVFQYALTQDAYDYWNILKKNTESVGSIFDPQPSLNISNIRCVENPEEIVIGYISAGSISKQRIFIQRNQIPNWHYFANCFEEKVRLDSLEFFFGGGELIPTIPDYIPPAFEYTHMKGSTPVCVDCRLTGTNIKPAFWP